MSVATVDLRSDTVTRPTPAMREAIARAEVGDDVLGDDPTTRRLEARVAELLGKEASLFFPSGTMANQAALAVLGAWGGEVILDGEAHILRYEEGAAAALSGLQLRPIASQGGALSPADVEAALNTTSRYLPRTRVVTLEQTHLGSGGSVLPLETIQGVAEVAARHGLALHLDGARLWNACAASGVPPAAYARHADTVMVSLSKGLGAPVGSLLAGSRELMEEAWRVRRRLGGAMRQSGLLAAAGLHALDHHMDRLVEDHANAKRLAAAVGQLPGLYTPPPQTNVVLLAAPQDPSRLDSLLSFLEKDRILMLKFGSGRLRAVTHMDVDEAGISRTVGTFARWAQEQNGEQ